MLNLTTAQKHELELWWQAYLAAMTSGAGGEKALFRAEEALDEYRKKAVSLDN